MALTKVQRARLVIKVDELTKERANLEHKLNQERTLNEYACNAYGSELAAGGMLAQEQAIASEIALTQEAIDLFKSVLDGKLDLGVENELQKQLENLDKEVMALQSKREQLRRSLKQISQVKSFL